MENVRIGILGLGAISGIYLKNLTGLFRETEVVGIYDLIPRKNGTGAKGIWNSQSLLFYGRNVSG